MLENLFEDRNKRKFIKESIDNALDIGNGTCKCCGSDAYVLEAFDTVICEDCCNKLINIAEDLDVELPKEIDESTIQDMVSESWVYLDTKKLQDEADKNYSGDVKALLKTYKIAPVNMDMAGGRIELNSSAQKSGKTRVNQLMIDFDGSHGTEKVALNQVPDADGTLAPLRVKGKLINNGVYPNGQSGTSSKGQNLSNTATPAQSAVPSPKAPANSASTSNSGKAQSARKSVSTVASGSVTGTVKDFSFKSGDVEFKLGVTDMLFINGKAITTPPANVLADISKAKDVKSASAILKKELATNPQNYFDSFEGINKGVVTLPNYSVYKFAFDENSFEKDITMCVVYNGKVSSKNRVKIDGKALTNKSVLNTILNGYMDGLISAHYEVFTKGNNEFNTSVGKAVIELKDMDVQKNVLKVSVSWGSVSFDDEIDASLLKDKKLEECKQVLKSKLLLMNLSAVIPDIDNFLEGKPKNPQYSITFKNKSAMLWNEDKTDTFDVDMIAILNTKSFIYGTKGDLEFLVSLENVGSVGSSNIIKKVPDNGIGEPYVLRKITGADTFLDFLGKASQDLVNKYVHKGSKDTSGEGMKSSAIDKMNNPSKRVALLKRMGDDFQEILFSYAEGKGKGSVIEDSTLDLDIRVNNNGELTSARFTLTTDYPDAYSGSDDYLDAIDNVVGGYLKSQGCKVVSNVILNSDGDYEVSCSVDKGSLDNFASILKMSVYEGMILFNTSSDSGRKVISVLND